MRMKREPFTSTVVSGVEQPGPARRTARRDRWKWLAPGTEAVRRRLGQLAQREQLVDAGAPRVLADLGVQLFAGLVAQLAHVAQHQQAFAGRERPARRSRPCTESGLAL